MGTCAIFHLFRRLEWREADNRDGPVESLENSDRIFGTNEKSARCDLGLDPAAVTVSLRWSWTTKHLNSENLSTKSDVLFRGSCPLSKYNV